MCWDVYATWWCQLSMVVLWTPLTGSSTDTCTKASPTHLAQKQPRARVDWRCLPRVVADIAGGASVCRMASYRLQSSPGHGC